MNSQNIEKKIVLLNLLYNLKFWIIYSVTKKRYDFFFYKKQMMRIRDEFDNVMNNRN